MGIFAFLTCMALIGYAMRRKRQQHARSEQEKPTHCSDQQVLDLRQFNDHTIPEVPEENLEPDAEIQHPWHQHLWQGAQAIFSVSKWKQGLSKPRLEKQLTVPDLNQAEKGIVLRNCKSKEPPGLRIPPTCLCPSCHQHQQCPHIVQMAVFQIKQSRGIMILAIKRRTAVLMLSRAQPPLDKSVQKGQRHADRVVVAAHKTGMYGMDFDGLIPSLLAAVEPAL